MSSFQLQADMYNSITPGEIEAKKLEERVKKLEERVKKLEKEIRPHGKWIEHQDCHDDTYYTCSHCGEDWTTIEGDPMDNLMNYCPMCGADMREADNGKSII